MKNTKVDTVSPDTPSSVYSEEAAVAINSNCVMKLILAEDTCPLCKGKGVYEESECSMCDGKGVMEYSSLEPDDGCNHDAITTDENGFKFCEDCGCTFATKPLCE
ncbi:hypothetical protein [Thiopseudomonas alkaliphila]|uniref:hypothetical protein n=1 Tax=Thiopseudomonas alkaliphila TaxID=1697053 RepID=UPI0025782D4A|nr:hypothetical protein [Thiopseudomonas alkaliphila]MDM1717363.1 hypothetical protein [Thiopseudomonas alkaliphila]